MADKNIQFKEVTDDGNNLLFPKTKGEMVQLESGTLTKKLGEVDILTTKQTKDITANATAIEKNKTDLLALSKNNISYDVIV